MKRFLIAAVVLVTSVLFIVSCISRDDTLYYGLTDYGVVQGANRILTDDDIVLTIVQKECNENLDTMGRVAVFCDLLRKVSETEYEINLREIQSMKIVSPVLSTSPQAEARVYDDPVCLQTAWFSGGYLNLTLSYYVKKGSTTPHTLLFVEDRPCFDETQDIQIDINLRIYHEGGGESFANPDIDMDQLNQVNTFVSIPFGSLDPYHGGPAQDDTVVRLTRLWHLYDSGVLERETQLYNTYGTVKY